MKYTLMIIICALCMSCAKQMVHTTYKMPPRPALVKVEVVGGVIAPNQLPKVLHNYIESWKYIKLLETNPTWSK